jgi:hypothetical protein
VVFAPQRIVAGEQLSPPPANPQHRANVRTLVANPTCVCRCNPSS